MSVNLKGFIWREGGSPPSPPERKHYPSHPDPTANAAIGNIMREERRKKRRAQHRGPRTQVWREEDDYAGK